jgi:hypothetical protein
VEEEAWPVTDHPDRGAFSIPEAAAWLGFSEQHFRRHVLKAVGFFHVGSLPRVRRADLEAWLANQRVSSSVSTEEPGSSVAPLTVRGSSVVPESEIQERARQLREKAARYSGPSCAEIARSRGHLRPVQSPTRGR